MMLGGRLEPHETDRDERERQHERPPDRFGFTVIQEPAAAREDDRAGEDGVGDEQPFEAVRAEGCEPEHDRERPRHAQDDVPEHALFSIERRTSRAVGEGQSLAKRARPVGHAVRHARPTRIIARRTPATRGPRDTPARPRRPTSTSASGNRGWSGSEHTSAHTRDRRSGTRRASTPRTPPGVAADRIVHERADALRGQMRLETRRGHRRGPETGDTRDRDRIPAARRPGMCQRGAIARGDRPPPRIAGREQRQTRAQDGRLHLVEAAVHAELRVMGIRSVCPPLRRRFSRSASDASLVATAPASPSAPRFFVG